MIATATLPLARAQESWSGVFNHEIAPSPNATDHLTPFGGYADPNVEYFTIFGQPLSWNFPAGSRSFNAVHMCLIPKGPYQGRVLVWDIFPVVVRNLALSGTTPPLNPPLGPNEYWACQAYSIVDPAPTPSGPRFRNYLLPIRKWDSQVGGKIPNLFCSGHTYSQYGDLIVVGGTEHAGAFSGATLTFALNFDLGIGSWPGATGFGSLYPGPNDFGLWQPGPPLQHSRFYPTATLTGLLNRLTPAREAVVVFGGAIDDTSQSPVVNFTWNEYEALTVDSRCVAGSSGLGTDTIGGLKVWPGPGSAGTPPPVDEDWLENYPRVHLLSTGKLFFSGYAPRWAQLDHDSAPGSWTRQSAPPWSSNWQHARHDGSSILFPNVGGTTDLVVRVGGADASQFAPSPTNGTTNTFEVFLPAPPPSTSGIWWNLGAMPNTDPTTLPDGRYLMNLVILPDASLLVLGGSARSPHGAPVPVTAPLLWNGQWNVLRRNPVPSVRDYHSTAVLLPDGRVFHGGGNGRNWDYEIFSPAYLAAPAVQRPQNVVFQTAVPFDSLFDAYQLGYNATYRIKCDPLPLGVTVQKVVLMAPGSTTHHSDMNQRYVEATITQQLAPSLVEFRTPLNEKFAPRGIYMAFLVTSAGIPSNATWVFFQ